MSEVTNAPAITDAVKAEPKAKRTRAARVEHNDAIKAYAKAKGIDDVRAGKQFRAVLRANREAYVKNGGTPHVKNTPWGSHPRKALKTLFPAIKQFQG